MNTITFCGICKSVNDAAKSGHLECLEYLHKKGCPWDEQACSYAAEKGHLECLKYLHENGCPWDERACRLAANSGHLECLQYLHENKCPWDKWACNYAATNGHIDCLEYLHKNECPWTGDACKLADEFDQKKILKYLHKNGCPCTHNRSKLEIYSTKFDIQAEKKDPDTRSAGGPAGASRFVATECCICYKNLNKVQFKPCNHTLCIGCSNKRITKNNAENKDTTCPFCHGNVKENLLLAN